MAMNMPQIARSAIDQMPPACRFSARDGQVILAHQEFLLALEPQMIELFYDTLFEHPPTAAVFFDGERPDRESTLSGWWRRTVTGPLDAQYFTWMARVGMAHVFRGVSNPMMLAMADLVAAFVAEQAVQASLGQPDAAALAGAFNRLAGTVGVVITYGYDESIGAALSLTRVRALNESTRNPEPPGAPATA
jgi:Protoglobin